MAELTTSDSDTNPETCSAEAYSQRLRSFERKFPGIWELLSEASVSAIPPDDFDD
jgi:hypothetical protein